MPANVDPIYSRAGDLQWSGVAVATANTAYDGTGTVQTCFTADATNGGYVDRLIIQPNGTNAATRFTCWVNNGSTPATAANNQLLAQITLAATTSSNSAALPSYEIPVRMAFPLGYKITWAIATAGTGGWSVLAVGGKY